MTFSRLRSRRAFTLVEVLLATVLAAMLLVALWSMLSMYSKVFEGGYARTEQAQLARTLLEQLNVDLQSTRQPQRPPARPVNIVTVGGAADYPPSPGDLPASASQASPRSGNPAPGAARPSASAAPIGSPPTVTALRPVVPPGKQQPRGAPSPLPSDPAPALPGAAASPTSAAAVGGNTVSTTSLRPAGLFGTDSFLQMDIWQPVLTATEYEFDDVRQPGAPLPSRVDELKTISYSFEEISDPADPSGPPVYYLLRREMSWEEAHPGQRSSVESTSSRPSRPFESASSDGRNSAELRSEELDLERLMEDEHTTVVPEVLSFTLQYFDGAQWSEEWDSIARGGLPMAVEVTMQLRAHDEPEDEDQPVDAGVDYEKRHAIKHPEFRLLIPISAAQPTGHAGSGSSLPASPLSDPPTSGSASSGFKNFGTGGSFDAIGNE